jgi:hypothetical protein
MGSVAGGPVKKPKQKAQMRREEPATARIQLHTNRELPGYALATCSPANHHKNHNALVEADREQTPIKKIAKGLTVDEQRKKCLWSRFLSSRWRQLYSSTFSYPSRRSISLQY